MSSKKKRMSMLDSLAAAGGPSATPAGSMMSTNRALRSARDAVDSHHVWELDPEAIEDTRLSDRLQPADVADLRDAIETNGQTVPILVRRHPTLPDRYLLVYGRRRLEAIKSSDKVDKVRALVASLDEDAAMRAQISENMARRDLSYIEKALFARELVDSGFGNQSRVAEVLTVTKSSISMALAIVETVGADLIRAIGPAHGIGRPKWEALGSSIEDTGANRETLENIAHDIWDGHTTAVVIEGAEAVAANDPSVDAFEAVMKALVTRRSPAGSAQSVAAAHDKNIAKARKRRIKIDGQGGGAIARTTKGVTLSLDNSAFADWVEAEAEDILEELHARWLKRGED